MLITNRKKNLKRTINFITCEQVSGKLKERFKDELLLRKCLQGTNCWFWKTHFSRYFTSILPRMYYKDKIFSDQSFSKMFYILIIKLFSVLRGICVIPALLFGGIIIMVIILLMLKSYLIMYFL